MARLQVIDLDWHTGTRVQGEETPCFATKAGADYSLGRGECDIVRLNE